MIGSLYNNALRRAEEGRYDDAIVRLHRCTEIISEKDLELRGSGEFFGTRQHGIPEFKIANLFEDIDLLKLAQGISFKIIGKDPLLVSPENAQLRKMVREKFSDRIEL